jgi:hypothetical protein
MVVGLLGGAADALRWVILASQQTAEKGSIFLKKPGLTIVRVLESEPRGVSQWWLVSWLQLERATEILERMFRLALTIDAVPNHHLSGVHVLGSSPQHRALVLVQGSSTLQDATKSRSMVMIPPLVRWQHASAPHHPNSSDNHPAVQPN